MVNITTMKKVILIAEPQLTIINTLILTVTKKDMNMLMNMTTNTITLIVMPTVMTMIMAANIPTKQSTNMTMLINTLILTPINMSILMLMKDRIMPMVTSILTGMNIPILMATVMDIAGTMPKMVLAAVMALMSKIKILKF
jgi:hypothetical protein